MNNRLPGPLGESREDEEIVRRVADECRAEVAAGEWQ